MVPSLLCALVMVGCVFGGSGTSSPKQKLQTKTLLCRCEAPHEFVYSSFGGNNLVEDLSVGSGASQEHPDGFLVVNGLSVLPRSSAVCLQTEQGMLEDSTDVKVWDSDEQFLTERLFEGLFHGDQSPLSVDKNSASEERRDENEFEVGQLQQKLTEDLELPAAFPCNQVSADLSTLVADAHTLPSEPIKTSFLCASGECYVQSSNEKSKGSISTIFFGSSSMTDEKPTLHHSNAPDSDSVTSSGAGDGQNIFITREFSDQINSTGTARGHESEFGDSFVHDVAGSLADTEDKNGGRYVLPESLEVFDGAGGGFVLSDDFVSGGHASIDKNDGHALPEYTGETKAEDDLTIVNGTNAEHISFNLDSGGQTSIDEDEITEPRIVGGTPVEEGIYPFFAHTTAGQLCGGTLIHEDILLTAAHCGNSFDSGVIIGSVERFFGDFIGVDVSFPHPAFVDPILNDIMLIKLTEPSTAPVAAWNVDSTEPQTGNSVTVIGYGATEEGGVISDVLLEAEVIVVDDQECRSFRDYDPTLMICAGIEAGGVDACQGDSGGPLFNEAGVIVGVVSAGDGCARPNSPSIYTEVSAYDAWIRQGICDLSDNPPPECTAEESAPPSPSPTDRPSKGPSLFPSLAPAPTSLPTPASFPLPSVSPSSKPVTLDHREPSVAPSMSSMPTAPVSEEPSAAPSNPTTPTISPPPTKAPPVSQTQAPSPLALEPVAAPVILPVSDPVVSPVAAPFMPVFLPVMAPVMKPVASPNLPSTVTKPSKSDFKPQGKATIFNMGFKVTMMSSTRRMGKMKKIRYYKYMKGKGKSILYVSRAMKGRRMNMSMTKHMYMGMKTRHFQKASVGRYHRMEKSKKNNYGHGRKMRFNRGKQAC